MLMYSIYSLSRLHVGVCIHELITAPQGCDTHTMRQPWIIPAEELLAPEIVFCSTIHFIDPSLLVQILGYKIM